VSPPLDAHDQEGQPLEYDQQISEEVVHLGGAGNRPRMLPVGCCARRGSARDALPGPLSDFRALPDALAERPFLMKCSRRCLSARTRHARVGDGDKSPPLRCSA